MSSEKNLVVFELEVKAEYFEIMEELELWRTINVGLFSSLRLLGNGGFSCWF